MVGISDIPCAGKIVDIISDATADPLFRGFLCLYCYKDLVNVFNSEIEKVNIQKGRVSRKVVAERADGKTVVDHVLKWQKEVDETQESAKEFREKYKNRDSRRCILCLSIFEPELDREAVQKAKKVLELPDSAKDLLADEIAHLPPVENVPTTAAVFQNFESRKDAYGKLY